VTNKEKDWAERFLKMPYCVHFKLPILLVFELFSFMPKMMKHELGMKASISNQAQQTHIICFCS